MNRFIVFAGIMGFVLYLNFSCVKSRQCSCYNSSTERTDTIFINGNKKDAGRACINLADSNEVCTLK